MIGTRLCFCLLVLFSGQLPAGTADPYQAIIKAESLRSGVPVALLTAVIRAESSFRPTAVSAKGAQGLMQLMPATAERFKVQNAFDPAQNIRGGSRYLAWLYHRYQHWPLALAAYNAGEGAVDRYGGMPPYRETRDYVHKVLQYYAKLTGQQNQPEQGQGRALQFVMQPNDQRQPPAGLIKSEKRDTEAEARASSVFFGE